jgi:predicted nucleic acid-binding protein
MNVDLVLKASDSPEISCMIAIDTNVLVYCVDFNEPTKQLQARKLLDGLVSAGDTVLLWQVVGEYLSCLRRFASANKFPAKD